VRIKLKPSISISNDADGKYRLFAPDDAKIERLIDSYMKQTSGIAQVAAAGTEALSLGDVTQVKGLWLSASKDCQVKLNGSATPLQLRKPTVVSGDDRAALVIEADITAVEITAGAEAVDIIYVIWGDAAA
jgi:hypothetical protein